MKKQNIEVEGGELLLESNEGHYAIIPAKDRQKVMKMANDGCDDCINKYIQTLPKHSDYAEDGSLIIDNENKKRKSSIEDTLVNDTIKSIDSVQDITNVKNVAPPIVAEKRSKYQSEDNLPKPAVLKADYRNDEERKISQEYSDKVTNPSLSEFLIERTLQRPLRWLANPMSGIGDIISTFAPGSDLAKVFPNSSAAELEDRKFMFNPNISTTDKIEHNIGEESSLTSKALFNALPLEIIGNMTTSTNNFLRGSLDGIRKSLKTETIESTKNTLKDLLNFKKEVPLTTKIGEDIIKDDLEIGEALSLEKSNPIIDALKKLNTEENLGKIEKMRKAYDYNEAISEAGIHEEKENSLEEKDLSPTVKKFRESKF